MDRFEIIRVDLIIVQFAGPIICQLVYFVNSELFASQCSQFDSQCSLVCVLRTMMCSYHDLLANTCKLHQVERSGSCMNHGLIMSFDEFIIYR